MNANTDRNAKIWNFTPTGTKAHAFVQTSRPGYKRAMCRANVEVLDSNYFFGPDVARSTCTRCEKLAAAMWDRAEASMRPATESHDLGYVAPVDERDSHVIRVDMDALHAEALVEDEGRTKASVLDLAHRHGVRVESVSMVDGELLVITETPEDSVRLRALRKSQAATQAPDWDAVDEAINHPAVIDALHDEALKMNREWDKSVAGYVHHCGIRNAVGALGNAAEGATTALQGLSDSLMPAAPRMNRRQRRAADRQARRVAGRNASRHGTDQG